MGGASSVAMTAGWVVLVLLVVLHPLVAKVTRA